LEIDIRSIILEYFPNANEDFMEYLLFHRTAYPFKGPEEMEQDIREACVVVKEALENGINLCDFCNTEAQKGKNICKKCEDGLIQATKDFNETILKK